ncbi:A/G-specific adenine glycosylase [Pelovirga terrestris]|uniref:Adenine DNA glycosylase n=1 Tax=Pelovirga terrestris TaxID=2771352 RepID=A0A8J6QNH3_9BACT|nr:A/G-specific adenine glycosylase [Pelovirga terrestris]MBD1400088.1 A/G-specific adenine glycosylase [Pelovirga terrestris]
MSDLPFNPADFARTLLGWYQQQGRDLPWRNIRDPYRIWVSEIMLQQTTVATVLGRYDLFLQQFPALADLATAPVEQVIDAWAGLGYYSRARNLHATAGRIQTDYGGIFPADPDVLQQLPGIGRSTAGAIVAIAYDRPAPILDANVRRVLCRLFALQQPPRSAAAEKQLWTWAELLTPEQEVHDYTQAMMDLGAMICLPTKPQCKDCPVPSFCLAYKQGLQQDIPLKTKKSSLPIRYQAVVVLQRQGRLQVGRRPVAGFLGGLWEFPTIDLEQGTAAEVMVHRFLSQMGLTGDPVPVGISYHRYSHFKLESLVYLVDLADNLLVAETQNQWKTREELDLLALHGAHKKVFEKVRNAPHVTADHKQ